MEIKNPFRSPVLRKILNSRPTLGAKGSFINPPGTLPGDALTAPTISPEKLQDILLQEFYYKVDALADYHFIKTDLRARELIIQVLQPLLGMVCQEGCNVVSDDISLRKVEKVWEPTEVGFSLVQCYSDLQKQQLYFLGEAGGDSGNLLNSASFRLFWAKMSIDFAFSELYRKAYFDNESGITIADYTPQPADGSWSRPTQDYFSCIKGIWAQLIDDGFERVTITENTAAGQVLSPAAARAYMNQLMFRAPVSLTGSNPVFLMTRSFYNALFEGTTLETNFTGGPMTPSTQDGGYAYMTRARWGNYPIVIREDWDWTIQNFLNDGGATTTPLFNPHRVIFTAPDNIAIGFDVTRLGDIFGTPHYDPRTDTVMQRVKTMLDAKVLEHEKTIFAY